MEKDAVVNSWIEWKEELSDDMEDVLTTMEDLCCECCRIIEGVVEDVNDDDNRGGIEVSVIETVLSDWFLSDWKESTLTVSFLLHVGIDFKAVCSSLLVGPISCSNKSTLA